MTACLAEIVEAKVPEDGLVLQMLHKEMLAWPYLEENFQDRRKSDRSLSDVSPVGLPQLGVFGEEKEPEKVGEKKDEKSGSLVGYGALLTVTLFPVLIFVWFLSTLN